MVRWLRSRAGIRGNNRENFECARKKIKISEIVIDVPGKVVYILPAFPPHPGVAWSVIASVAQW